MHDPNKHIHPADLEEALQICASEAIHQIASIQPTGILLGIEPKNLIIRTASCNSPHFFPDVQGKIIGRHLGELLNEEAITWLKQLLAKGPWSGARIWSITLHHAAGKKTHDAQVFMAGDLVAIEIEEWEASNSDVFHDLFIPIRDALWKLDSETDLGRYAQSTVDQVRVLTGFDRVMMYRFDSNWDGEVIAESKVVDVDSYLGNRFPASDIPPQARELYTKNLVRIIADVDAEPVPLTSHTSDPMDLSHSWLRSMSPVHVEYLRNMGVRASLSISLVQNERLWGLIACHHFSPRYVSLRSRELDEFIGRVVSLKLLNMDTIERDSMGHQIRDLLYELTELIRSSDDLESIIVLLKEKLLGLVRSEGAIVTIEGTRHLLGNVPPQPVVDKLIEVLKERPIAPVFHTDNLAELLDGFGKNGGTDDQASGILIAPLDQKLNNYVVWFRPGVLRTLRWAGNPQKSLVQGTSGPHISPRKSFETWIQTYHDKSMPWSQVEIDAANSLSLALIEVLAQKALKSSEESYRLLAENSTDMIARLGLDGTFRFTSPACQDLFGRDSGQLIGLNLKDVVEESADSIATLLLSLQNLGALSTKIIRCKSINGSDLWVEATLKHTLGTHGEPEILINARNVTQRYNYQLAIEDVHRRHTQILAAAGEGVLSLDSSGFVVYANETASKILGHEDDDMVGKYCCHVFFCPPVDSLVEQTPPPCPFISTLRDGETRQGTQTFGGNEDRPAILLQYVCTPLVDNNLIHGCVVVFSEKVQKSGADQSIAAEVILDEAVEAVMVTDPLGRITTVNRAFTEITGYSADEAIGQTPRLLKSGVHTPHFYQQLWQLLHEKRRWVGEIWNRRKNGEIYPQWGSLSAILDNAGNVQNYVSVFSDISKAKQAEERLFHMANHDSLTGLPNRMNFSEQLGQTLQRCKRQECGAAVVFIDLDRFKIINDTLGHAIGDKYLKIVAERLSSATRKQDLLARWGGDEFVMAMEGQDDPRIVGETLTRLIVMLAEPIHLGGHELIPTASIGVAIYPEDGSRSAELIKAADTAMYGAKQRGRNCYEFYSKEMAKDLSAKLLMSSELRHAMDERQFFLEYQPQIDPSTLALQGVEALARWRHPLRGKLPPSDFLPILEELGLIGELGDWALDEACSQIRRWDAQGVTIPKVSVNVAPSQLKNAFVSTVAATIHRHQIDPFRLELEITEGALESGEVARKITGDLRKLGVLLAVDDFGTGYSSLSHIKLFPINCFKIDKSFVDGVPGNAADVAIIRAILALGSSFKLEIIAEGVETEEQVNFLKNEGVTNIQGYYYAFPMPADQLVEWLKKQRPMIPQGLDAGQPADFRSNRK
ncbi:MAG: diguanylate cyclase/phosphodiesterase with and sensor(s) [Proteobacteria bacterium]|nr:diguanylate cyclase/phosphodiesterase with and sensor(s) [Pseudomonadota bacterium]